MADAYRPAVSLVIRPCQGGRWALRNPLRTEGSRVGCAVLREQIDGATGR